MPIITHALLYAGYALISLTVGLALNQIGGQDGAAAFMGGMDTPITNDPDTGLAWRPRFDPKTLLIEERMLQAACYIVCAYLTGMRDAEVQAMRSGCLEARRSEDGLVERYRVKSTVYKRRDGRGQAVCHERATHRQGRRRRRQDGDSQPEQDH